MSHARAGRPLATVAAALALLLAVPGAGLAAPDPRQLFADGQFEAAGAAFEARWREGGKLQDGINATIAWRAAGRYAHARVLLGEVVARTPPTGAAAARVELLTRKLEELTALIELAGVAPGDVVKIDGVPAERLDGAFVADVGRRELVVERPHCQPLRRALLLRPGERVRQEVTLACPQRAGSLHVSLSGAQGAEVRVDGQPHAMTTFDLDVPLEPGRHRLVVRRRGLLLLDDEVEVGADGTTRRRVRVPWRAKAGGLTVGAMGAGLGGGVGAMATTGVTFGYFSGLTPDPVGGRASIGLWAGFGVITTTIDGLDEGAPPWLGLGAWLRVFGPLWQARVGRTLWTLDVDPLSLQFGGAHRGGTFTNDLRNVFTLHTGSISLTAELPWTHAELVLWPAGMTWGEGIPGGDRRYAAALSLHLGWAFFGN